MNTDDTIAAIATATGSGAIGIVRISGPDAESVLRRCFAGLPDPLMSHHLYFGRVIHPKGGEVLDEALGVLMRGPRSFTGEDVAEIQCHGGPLNLRRVLEAILSAHARQAEPGEFSLRAFLNGRLDLTQAEAISEIINAESEVALRTSQAQLGGSLRRPISALRARLLQLLTLVEASIDFAGEEDVYTFDREGSGERVDSIRDMISRMLKAHEGGRLTLGGARVVFVGEPNVGKSSLFNRFIGEDRAIVTEVAGTTRDLIVETTSIGAHRVHLVDTAGLREARDIVEQIGVERTKEQASSADLIAWIIEAGAPLPSPPAEVLDAALRDAVVCVVNKVDALDPENSPGQPSGRRQRGEVKAQVRGQFPTALSSLEVLTISAKTGEGLAWLEGALAERVAALQGRSEEDVPLVTSTRHAEALRAALEALDRAHDALLEELPLECVAEDLREGTEALGVIVGAIATDEVLVSIFSSFCIGK